MPTLVWLILAFLYIAALLVLGISTLRKGHTVLFWVGIRLSDPLDRRGPHGADATGARHVSFARAREEASGPLPAPLRRLPGTVAPAVRPGV